MLYRDFMQKFRPLFSPDADGADMAAAAGGAPPAVESAAPPVADAAAAASATEAAAAPAAETAPQSEPSLLESATGKKPEAAADGADKGTETPAPADAAKPDGDKDAKPDGDKKPEGEADPAKKDAAETDPAKKDATAEAQPPAPIKYDAFKVPEGLALDQERVAKFAEIAGPAQVSQEVAQQLLDLHVAEMQKFAQDVTDQAAKHQRETWNKLNDTWKTELRNDAELGGNRLETSLSMAKAVIEEYGGNADQVRDLLAHTSNNGMGNYPGFVRLLANIGQALNVFEDGIVPASPSPPNMPKSRGEKWYGGKGNGAQP